MDKLEFIYGQKKTGDVNFCQFKIFLQKLEMESFQF